MRGVVLVVLGVGRGGGVGVVEEVVSRGKDSLTCRHSMGWIEVM